MRALGPFHRHGVVHGDNPPEIMDRRGHGQGGESLMSSEPGLNAAPRTPTLSGSPLTVMGSGSQTRSLCFVDDTVQGILALASSDQPGPINLGNPDEVTVYELATRIRDLVSSDSAVEFVGAHPDDPQRRRPDISKTRELLGWCPHVSLDQGIKRTIGWFAEANGTPLDR